MSALTSLLVRDEVVSVQQIEDALQHQVLEGGEIDTALLELDAVAENVLNAYRAATYRLPPASREAVMDVPHDTLERLPVALARQHRMVPIGWENGRLWLAVSRPLEPKQLHGVETGLGVFVALRVATEVRIEAALARHYGLEIAPRMQRLAEQLDRWHPGPLPSVEPMQPSDIGALRVDELLKALEESDDSSDEAAPMPPGTGRPPPSAAKAPVSVRSPAPLEVTERLDASAPRSGDGPSQNPRVRLKRAVVPKGPLTKERARKLLDAADTRDDVITVLFRYARQYFDCTVFFSVRGDRAFGVEADGAKELSDVHALSVILERGCTLDDMTRALLPRVVDLSRKESDHALAHALGRMEAQPCALVPVFIRQRVVSFVYGDRSGEPFRIDEVSDVVELLPSVSRAFERIIRTRKVFALQSRRPSRAPSQAPSKPISRAPSEAPRASLPAASKPAPQRAPAAKPSSLPASRKTAGASAGPPPTTPAARRSNKRRRSQPDASLGLDPQNARAALSTLGVPRAAPPPPSVSMLDAASGDSDEFEHIPTVKLPPTPSLVSASLSPRAVSPTLSKPPPGAGSYRSATDEPGEKVREERPSRLPPERILPSIKPQEDKRPIRRSHPPLPPLSSLSPEQMPDPSDPPAAISVFVSSKPARTSKQPPGTGTYSLQDAEEEIVTLSRPPRSLGAPRSLPPPLVSRRPSAALTPLRPSALPPSLFSDEPRQGEVHVPPPPRLPGGAMSVPAGRRRLHRSSISTPRFGPRRERRRSIPVDVRQDDGGGVPTEEVVLMSRAVRDSIRPLRTSESSSGELVEIVDENERLQELIADLCRSGPDEEARVVESLLRYGQDALELLTERFPGPLWIEGRRPHSRLPAGRDVSAIARALLAFGASATPYLAKLLSAADPDRRFYATLLVSDRAEPALLELLCDRVLDDDPQIRLVVKDTLSHYRSAPGFDGVVARLRVKAADDASPMHLRLAALDALTVLRDPDSVPLLIELNARDDKQLSVPAHRALVAITAQDFGGSQRKWTAFWKEHGRRHRIEWLIGSLMHNEQTIRAAAGSELQKLTQVHYDYVAGASKRERERTQKRYREWWDIEGKRRFASG